MINPTADLSKYHKYLFKDFDAIAKEWEPHLKKRTFNISGTYYNFSHFSCERLDNVCIIYVFTDEFIGSELNNLINNNTHLLKISQSIKVSKKEDGTT